MTRLSHAHQPSRQSGVRLRDLAALVVALTLTYFVLVLVLSFGGQG